MILLSPVTALVLMSFFFFLWFSLFFERGREGERESERHQCVGGFRVLPPRDPACNPDMCPDWESNLRPFGVQAGAQSTEPHQPGPDIFFVRYKYHARFILFVCMYIMFRSFPFNLYVSLYLKYVFCRQNIFDFYLV